MPNDRVPLRPGWFSREFGRVDPRQPGIYEWSICGKDKRKLAIYVGKAKNVEKRCQRYERNVRRLLNGLPYHIMSRDYRAVHYALREAHDRHGHVAVSILENCDDGKLTKRESYWIDRRRREEKGGGPIVLNGMATRLARLLDLIRRPAVPRRSRLSQM